MKQDESQRSLKPSDVPLPALWPLSEECSEEGPNLKQEPS